MTKHSKPQFAYEKKKKNENKSEKNPVYVEATWSPDGEKFGNYQAL